MKGLEARVQQWYTDVLYNYVLTSYRAYITGEEYEPGFLEEYSLTRDDCPPIAARMAAEFYDECIAQQDLGSVSIFHPIVDDISTYAVYVTTDGDDGWLEVYADDGTLFGAARYYLELIVWGNQDVLRSMATTGEYPPELTDRKRRTLWGKPLNV